VTYRKERYVEAFEPKIVGFLCKWCTAAAADLAGVTRLEYPANLRPLRVMCSGSVDPVFIIRALLSGADAVLVGGCHPGDCHYVSGNFKARRRIAMLRTIMKTFDLGEERVHLKWISASEGRKFADTAKEITEKVKEMGKNPLASYWQV
jgi:F420-non-reducing hydrogenase iron-sulfur subunit